MSDFNKDFEISVKDFNKSLWNVANVHYYGTESGGSHMTRQYLIEICYSVGDGCCSGDCYHGDHYEVAGGGVVFVFGPALLCAH